MRALAILAVLILSAACRPLAGSPPPRVPDTAADVPNDDDWRRAFRMPESARAIASIRGESVETVLCRMARINMHRRVKRVASPPVVPKVRRASFSIDDASGAIRIPDPPDKSPVYASPQSPPTSGVITPGRPATVTVPFASGHGHVAMTNPAPVYSYYQQPTYTAQYPAYYAPQPMYSAPTMPYYAAPRRGIFGSRLFRGGGGSCFVNADGSVSCGR